MITHGNLASNAAALVSAWGFTPSDRLLHALPIYHAHGLFVGLGCTLMSGASMMFLPRFDAGEVVAQLGGCTVMMGVPTFYARLLREPGLDRAGLPEHPPVHLRLGTTVARGIRGVPGTYGSRDPRALRHDGDRHEHREPAERRAPRRQRRPAAARRDGAHRRARRPARCAAGETGEIELRGANVFPGYWRLPEQTAESFTADGYFRTGDLGFRERATVTSRSAGGARTS